RGRHRSALWRGRTRRQMAGLPTPVTAHVMSFVGPLPGLMRTVRERAATDRRPASWPGLPGAPLRHGGTVPAGCSAVPPPVGRGRGEDHLVHDPPRLGRQVD